MLGRPSFIGFLIASREVYPISFKDQYPQQKKPKSDNRFVAHHIRQQNQVKLRRADNHQRFRMG